MSFEEDFKNLDWSWHTIREKEEWPDYFGGTFAKNDIFFCHLNEIEPRLVENFDDDDLSEDDDILIDPRTNEMVEKIIEDHSDESKVVIEDQSDESMMTNELISNQRATKLVANSKIAPQKPLKKSLMECAEMLKKVLKLQSSQYKRLRAFVAARYLDKLESESKDIVDWLKESFSLQTAIPLGGTSPPVTSCQIENIAKLGYVPEYVDDFKFKSIFSINQPVGVSQKSKTEEGILEILDETDVYIPEDALQILLCSFPSIETWEIPFTVKDSNSCTGKQIVFENPLPVRSNGDFTFLQTLENIVNTCMKQGSNRSLLCLANGNVSQNHCSQVLEINATDLNRTYAVEEFDEYLSRILNKLESGDSITIENAMWWEWVMKRENGKVGKFSCIAKSSIPYFKCKGEESKFLNATFKLVSEAGVAEEKMTREELMKEWLKLLFLPNGCTIRVYLDANTLEHISTQELSIIDVESELFDLYNLKPSDFLGSLYSIFEIMVDFPNGNYLLKFNPKYSEKILVYAETTESDPNKLDLKEVYKNIRSHVTVPLVSDEQTIITMEEIEDLKPSSGFSLLPKQKNCKSKQKIKINTKKTETEQKKKKKTSRKRKAKSVKPVD